ncbi:MAG: PIN domain nuclease [Pseudomonadota bacterium]|nr:PIN domain nuclease [Pseudomonadota bacterium]
MVVVDSSVWIDYFNGQENSQTKRLDDLLSSTIIIVGDLILAEVLRGFKRDRDFKTARSLLEELELVSMAGMEIALKSAENYRSLRKKGATVRKTMDCLIATYCIQKKLPLLYSDRDFSAFSQHLGLKSVLTT